MPTGKGPSMKEKGSRYPVFFLEISSRGDACMEREVAKSSQLVA